MYEECVIHICDCNVDMCKMRKYFCEWHSIVLKVVGSVDRNRGFGYDVVLYSIGDFSEL